jgi:hypothetical protein
VTHQSMAYPKPIWGWAWERGVDPGPNPGCPIPWVPGWGWRREKGSLFGDQSGPSIGPDKMFVDSGFQIVTLILPIKKKIVGSFN